nr:sugar transferase [uncultured Albidiferax sp.]
MKELLVAALIVAGGVAWAELREWLPWIAKRIVSQAVSAIPIEDRERMQEELTAELTAIPGKISPIVFAFSVWWGFWRTTIIANIHISASQRTVRALDIALGNLMVMLLGPLLLMSMLATYLSGRGPILLAIRCVGQNNQEFGLLRFRTRDVRTGKRSPLGVFMWRTRLDRVPELINVICGEMSLVGPPPNNHRPPDYVLMDLRPGIVWLQTGSTYDADSFGKSTTKTITTYFRLICDALIAFFCNSKS